MADSKIHFMQCVCPLILLKDLAPIAAQSIPGVGKLTVTITDQNKTALAEATVKARRANPGFEHTMTTHS